ncbi:MAG: hypothetical protein HGA78_00910 [Nitrospirales bacterium]|nr:hypothetical protein [Nitrospirales bacterium]
MEMNKREFQMTILLSLFLLMVFSGCTPAPLVAKEDAYAPIEASLSHINQKVAGHFLESGVPDGFNSSRYRAAVEEVCFPSPACKAQAEEIFSSFSVSARKVDNMFSVMLCDKEQIRKVMEDFSCNNRRVEIQSWKLNEETPCEFEADWQGAVQEFCPR